MTVGELIKELENYDSEMEVKYTLGGSCNFGEISYIGTESNGWYKKNKWVENKIVVIGELTW